jgi:hypothetical protein
MPRNATPAELEQMRERYDASVDRSGGPSACWPWRAAKCHQGYGRVTAFKVPFKPHRLALLYAGVDLSTEMLALHSCDNPSCCNPAHLRPGTQSENVRDMVNRKRRNLSGVNNGRARLDPERVRFVRRLLDRGHRQADIAFLFNVAKTTISAIHCGRNWPAV